MLRADNDIYFLSLSPVNRWYWFFNSWQISQRDEKCFLSRTHMTDNVYSSTRKTTKLTSNRRRKLNTDNQAHTISAKCVHIVSVSDVRGGNLGFMSITKTLVRVVLLFYIHNPSHYQIILNLCFIWQAHASNLHLHVRRYIVTCIGKTWNKTYTCIRTTQLCRHAWTSRVLVYYSVCKQWTRHNQSIYIHIRTYIYGGGRVYVVLY